MSKTVQSDMGGEYYFQTSAREYSCKWNLNLIGTECSLTLSASSLKKVKRGGVMAHSGDKAIQNADKCDQ